MRRDCVHARVDEIENAVHGRHVRCRVVGSQGRVDDLRHTREIGPPCRATLLHSIKRRCSYFFECMLKGAAAGWTSTFVRPPRQGGVDQLLWLDSVPPPCQPPPRWMELDCVVPQPLQGMVSEDGGRKEAHRGARHSSPQVRMRPCSGRRRTKTKNHVLTKTTNG